MSDSVSEHLSIGQCEKSEPFQGGSGCVAEVFEQLFKLLEEYAPAWYTEEHNNRALAALRIIEESQQAAGVEAKQFKKAG